MPICDEQGKVTVVLRSDGESMLDYTVRFYAGIVG
jgi:hypothetical protein